MTSRADCLNHLNWQQGVDGAAVCVFDEDGKRFEARLPRERMENLRDARVPFPQIELAIRAAVAEADEMPILTPGGMRIVAEKPPEWIMKGCMDQFRFRNIDRTFWTYGDVIYNPGGMEIPDHIIAHEERHMAQQAGYQGCQHKSADEPCTEKCQQEWGKDAWWRHYLEDPRFRLEQEAEAYGVQYRYYCDRVHNRDARAKFLFGLSDQLAGPLYQVALARPQARALIEVLSGNKALADVA